MYYEIESRGLSIDVIRGPGNDREQWRNWVTERENSREAGELSTEAHDGKQKKDTRVPHWMGAPFLNS